jgi:RNA polymerase sigma factor (sigma-70 family)
VSAEDFAAEAISRALGRRRAAPIESFRPYLRRVLVNLILRHERRIATESRATVRGWSRPAEDEPAGIVVARNEISRALDRLSLDQRAVVVLRYLEDMSLLEVADVLRIPVGTVESRASRAMATLRSVLTEGDRHG